MLSMQVYDTYVGAGVLYNLSREFDKAERAFRTGLEIDPRNYSLWSIFFLLFYMCEWMSEWMSEWHVKVYESV